jgi:hypothetical protein
MPATARELGVTDPHDDGQAIPAAGRYLAQNVKRFGVAGGVAAYNAGPGAVERHGGIPPYPETQAYVRRVTGALDGADIFADDDKAAPKADQADGSDIFADKPPPKAGAHDAPTAPTSSQTPPRRPPPARLATGRSSIAARWTR